MDFAQFILQIKQNFRVTVVGENGHDIIFRGFASPDELDDIHRILFLAYRQRLINEGYAWEYYTDTGDVDIIFTK